MVFQKAFPKASCDSCGAGICTSRLTEAQIDSLFQALSYRNMAAELRRSLSERIPAGGVDSAGSAPPTAHSSQDSSGPGAEIDSHHRESRRLFLREQIECLSKTNRAVHCPECIDGLLSICDSDWEALRRAAARTSYRLHWSYIDENGSLHIPYSSYDYICVESGELIIDPENKEYHHWNNLIATKSHLGLVDENMVAIFFKEDTVTGDNTNSTSPSRSNSDGEGFDMISQRES